MKPYETLTVCGSEIHLKITAANAVKLENEIGTDIMTGLEKIAEVRNLAKYYFYAAVSQNDSINKIDDIYQHIRLLGKHKRYLQFRPSCGLGHRPKERPSFLPPQLRAYRRISRTSYRHPHLLSRPCPSLPTTKIRLHSSHVKV